MWAEKSRLVPLIRTRDLVKEYRLGRGHAVRALGGVTVDVERGDYIALLGRSGSGKSTLLNVVGGLDRPTAGSVEVDGTNVATLSERALAAFRATTVGFVFQSFHLQPRFQAWENVALPLVFAGERRPERRRRAHELLDRVGLTERARHRPAELSGGEQQRVALARALVRRPPLLLADEPTGNLDTDTSKQILDLLGEVREQGMTILLVTHDQELAAVRAGTILRMADGCIVEPPEVRE